MDIFIDYFYCYYTAWNEGFSAQGGGVLLADSFHRFSSEKTGGLHEISVVRRISARGNWMEKPVFCAVFIYLFIICLLIAIDPCEWISRRIN